MLLPNKWAANRASTLCLSQCPQCHLLAKLKKWWTLSLTTMPTVQLSNYAMKMKTSANTKEFRKETRTTDTSWCWAPLLPTPTKTRSSFLLTALQTTMEQLLRILPIMRNKKLILNLPLCLQQATWSNLPELNFYCKHLHSRTSCLRLIYSNLLIMGYITTVMNLRKTTQSSSQDQPMAREALAEFPNSTVAHLNRWGS